MSDKVLAPLLAMLLLGFTSAGLGQTQEPISDPNKLIRIKKIATEWQGSILSLHTRDGDILQGRLIEVSGGNYHILQASKALEVPLESVVKVSFDPGLPEILLTIASTAMGAAFLSGAVLMVNNGASSSTVSVSALVGMVGGGLWGYSIFYETEVIELE